ncbi:MAG: AMIN domain-containing protein [Desulfobacterales bacterium]|nr:AMIN domain-containing protein [Desulfobacterales bacterium]
MHFSFKRMLGDHGKRPGPGTGYCRHVVRGLLVCGLIVAVLAMGAVPGRASDAKERFFQAQNCYEDLLDNPQKQQARSSWFACIDKFRLVYSMAPDGEWAAAGIYKTANLYAKMYKISYRKADIKEAEDLFRRITLRFPRSAYSKKAATALQSLAGKSPKAKTKLPAVVHADSPYGQAQAAYEQLKQNPRWQIRRDKWFEVIRKFENVYKGDPGGPAGPVSLYTTGELYLGLARKSYIDADRREARDIFRRVAGRFAGSPYAEKARKQLGALEKKGGTRSVPQKKPAQRTVQKGLEQKFNRAEKTYRTVARSKKLSQRRDKWEQVIARFQDVHDRDPAGPWAAAGLFRAGESYLELARHSGLRSDREKGLDLLADVVKTYPRSSYRAKASALLTKKGRPVSTVAAVVSGKVARRPQKPGKDAIAEQIFKANTESKTGREVLSSKVNPGTATVTGLRYWSNPNYTRIVIEADSEAAYTHRLLKKDPDLKKPQRLYVDLNKARLDQGIQRNIPINDNLLSDARAGQHDKGRVRVVVDIKSFRTYKIFPLKNPFRIVIDIHGQEKEQLVSAQPDRQVKIKGKIPPGAIARQFSLGVSRIVIDPGHGGRDYGAKGYYKGVHEKHVVLQISKKLAKKIKRQVGCEVLMTRTTDKYLTLEERTAFANTKNADLFISIHTNAIKDKRAYGIETYFLNLATDDDAIRVAALENATSTKNISDLQTILSDLMQNAKINESSRLAGNVQNSLYRNLKIHYKKVRSKGVKQAPFYVLLGAQMPAVLIETSFISNPRECKRLTNPGYQDRLCDGIIKGIKGYIKAINPTALRRQSGRKG